MNVNSYLLFPPCVEIVAWFSYAPFASCSCVIQLFPLYEAILKDPSECPHGLGQAALWWRSPPPRPRAEENSLLPP